MNSQKCSKPIAFAFGEANAVLRSETVDESYTGSEIV